MNRETADRFFNDPSCPCPECGNGRILLHDYDDEEKIGRRIQLDCWCYDCHARFRVTFTPVCIERRDEYGEPTDGLEYWRQPKINIHPLKPIQRDYQEDES